MYFLQLHIYINLEVCGYMCGYICVYVCVHTYKYTGDKRFGRIWLSLRRKWIRMRMINGSGMVWLTHKYLIFFSKETVSISLCLIKIQCKKKEEKKQNTMATSTNSGTRFWVWDPDLWFSVHVILSYLSSLCFHFFNNKSKKNNCACFIEFLWGSSYF